MRFFKKNRATGSSDSAGLAGSSGSAGSPRSSTMAKLQQLRLRAGRSRTPSPDPTESIDSDNDSSHSMSKIQYSGEEDDLDFATSDEDAYTGPHEGSSAPLSPLAQTHGSRGKHMSALDASSIIGGDNYDASRRTGNEDAADDDDDDDDDDNDDDDDDDEDDGEDDGRQIRATRSRKVFRFSLPFTSSTEHARSIPLISSLSNNSFVGKTLGRSDSVYMKQRQEIGTKIRRQTTLTSLEEELYYRDVKSLDDGKFSALAKSMKPKLVVKGWDMPVYDELEGDVLILGGYRGSILRDSTTHRRAWIPVIKAGLNIRKVNLLLGPKDEDEYNTEKTIYPDGILAHIGPVDIARRLMKRLKLNPKVHVHDFGYDWRLSIDISAKRLHDKLREIYEGNGHKPVLIIAHSMGGLVAHGAMQLGKSLVRGVLYVGTPCPCVNIMGPLRFNDSILLCNDMLTSEVNFMMRSSFIFVPRKGQCLFKDEFTGEHYDIDFFDPENWVKYNLSPIVSSVRLEQEKGNATDIKQQTKFAISYDEAYDYLSRTLRRTKAYLDSIEYDPNQTYPPMACVYGNCVPSVKYSLVNGEEGIKEGDYYNFFYGPGDGVTHEKWVFPKDTAYPTCGVFPSKNGHMGLLSDLKRVGLGIDAILREEKKRAAAAK